MMHPTALAAPLVAALSLLAPSRAHQATQPSVGVFRAAAAYLAADLSTRTPTLLSIDPRIIPTPRRGFNLTGAPTHPDSALAEMKIPGKTEVVSLQRAEQCSGMPALACRTNGVAAFASLTTPIIRGDSASVEVFLRTSVTPTAEDSARARASRSPASALARLERMGASTHMRLDLVRFGTGWRVARKTTLGQS